MEEVPLGELGAEVEKRWPGRLNPQQKRALSWKMHAAPEDLELILPYVFSIHGKAHNMVEIPGKPGQYEEPALMYAEVIEVLKKTTGTATSVQSLRVSVLTKTGY